MRADLLVAVDCQPLGAEVKARAAQLALRQPLSIASATGLALAGSR
jgi:hypothetical protein